MLPDHQQPPTKGTSSPKWPGGDVTSGSFCWWDVWKCFWLRTSHRAESAHLYLLKEYFNASKKTAELCARLFRVCKRVGTGKRGRTGCGNAPLRG